MASGGDGTAFAFSGAPFAATGFADRRGAASDRGARFDEPGRPGRPREPPLFAIPPA